MCCQMRLLTALTLVLTLPGAQSDVKTVTGTARQNITLHTGVTGLHGDYQVIWSHGPERHLLLNFDAGVLEGSDLEKFHLDTGTGALSIRSLSVSDGGLYQGQIINGNGSLHNFILTVVEADPLPPPTERPDQPGAEQRSRLVVAVPGCIFFVVLLVCAVTWQRNQRNPPG